MRKEKYKELYYWYNERCWIRAQSRAKLANWFGDYMDKMLMDALFDTEGNNKGSY